METINNVAAAAAKAVWGEGETNKEPVSGATGDVSKGEPYDAGNLETSEQNKISSTTGTAPTDTTTSTTGTHTDSTLADKVADKSSTYNSTTTGGDSDGASAKPAPADTSSGQNDVRHPDDVDDNKPAAGDVKRTPEDVNADEPAGDVTGPGPKSLDVVAKEHGGDAGNEGTTAADTTDSAAKDTDDKKKDGESEGTGEQWVKTSGLAADGGDFDATKPGAGREADRLMETKGMVHPDAKQAGAAVPADDASKTSTSTDDKKDKASLGDRIKAKLHKH